MPVEIRFMNPRRLKRNERRMVTRELKAKLVDRLAERVGLPSHQLSVLKADDGRIRAMTVTGTKFDFTPVEEQAIVDAIEWEKSGAGEGPKLPL